MHISRLKSIFHALIVTYASIPSLENWPTVIVAHGVIRSRVDTGIARLQNDKTEFHLMFTSFQVRFCNSSDYIVRLSDYNSSKILTNREISCESGEPHSLEAGENGDIASAVFDRNSDCFLRHVHWRSVVR